jgi:Na+/H+ antiporter
LLFLPPLIYEATAFGSPSELRENIRPIAMLGVGLVLATLIVVAVVAHSVIPHMSWAAAFVLGAVVAPPDAVAASTVAERLQLPRQIVSILEGESLVDDATALVGYRMAVAAVVTGAFSLPEAGRQFLLGATIGVAAGLAVAWLTIWVRTHLDDPPVELTISLLTPFAAYLTAEQLGVSGILAVGSAGLYVNWRSHTTIPASTRVQATAVWKTLSFLLTSLLFILLGLQSRDILTQLSNWPWMTLCGLAFLVCGAVLLMRIAWVFVFSALPLGLSRRARPPWQHAAVVAWAGLRGVDTLAAALALPLATAGGSRFPYRSLIIFLGLCVVLATLVLQGLSLPYLIRRLGVVGDYTAEREETKARLAAARAALSRLEELASAGRVSESMLKRLRSRYQHRIDHLKAQRAGVDDGSSEDHLAAHERVQLELLDAERRAVIELHHQGVISDEALRRVERDIDLEELRLDA